MKEKDIVPFNRHSIWLVLVACLGEVIFSVAVCRAEVPEPLYNINEATTIRPEEYRVRGRHLSLFPVPQDNAVGTNDLGNAITLLSFHKRRLSEDKYFRNAAHDFEGGGTYLPVIDKDTIGFAQSRRFLLFDFKSRNCRDYRIVMSLEKTIEEVVIADSKNKHFIFEIEAHNPGSVDPWDCTYHFLLMDLSGTEPKVLKEAPSNEGLVWSMVDEKIFLWEFDEKQLQVLNKQFEEDTHPLFKRAYEFSFSPDGKWVVFKEGGRMDAKKTYLMPVSEKYPNYLGSPILLANDYFDSGHFAWTTNPISFVGSSLDKLYRWELTNEAHPESDKPTFHDYIVEKDLEKLTRENRQGLGENPE